MKWWLFPAKMYHIYGEKISMHLSRYEKKSLLIDLHYYVFFRNYALRAELCHFASAHNSRSPDNDNTIIIVIFSLTSYVFIH